MPQVEVKKVKAVEDRSLPVFAELDRLADRIRVQAYNLFSRRGAADGHALEDWLAAEREVCWPSAELNEQDGRFKLKVALAGYEPGDITVTATPRELIVSAVHKRESQSGDRGVRWSEFHSSEVLRRVEVPQALNVEQTTATFTNGLLEIVAPKAEPAQQQKAEAKVEVSVGAPAKTAKAK
jgi:HSP20 family protein